MRLGNLHIPPFFKTRRANGQENQIFVAGIGDALGGVGGDAEYIAGLHGADGLAADFYFALTGKEVIDLVGATNGMEDGRDARFYAGTGDGQTGTVRGVEQFGDVTAFLEVVFRGLVVADNLCHTGFFVFNKYSAPPNCLVFDILFQKFVAISAAERKRGVVVEINDFGVEALDVVDVDDGGFVDPGKVFVGQLVHDGFEVHGNGEFFVGTLDLDVVLESFDKEDILELHPIKLSVGFDENLGGDFRPTGFNGLSGLFDGLEEANFGNGFDDVVQDIEVVTFHGILGKG